MRHQSKIKSSKLKLRSEGAAAETPLENHHNKGRLSQDLATRSRLAQRVKPTSSRPGKPGGLLSIAKGLLTLGVVALIMHQAAAFSFTTSTPDTQPSSDLTTDNNSGNAVTAAKVPTAVGADAGAKVSAETQPTLKNSQAPEAEAEAEAENIKPRSENKRDTTIANVVTSRNSISAVQANPAATDPGLHEGTTDTDGQGTGINTPQATDNASVKAYRATMFSSLSSTAVETPVAHGLSVRVLERKGEWVNIEIPGNNTSGYIHISQLRFW